MPALKELDAKWRKITSDESLEMFEKKYPNVLAMFDAQAVYSAIASYIKIEGLPEDVKADFSEISLCKFTEEAFLTLLKRGVLDQFLAFKREDKLPPEVDRELDQMEVSAGHKQAAPVIDPLKEAKDKQDRLLAECVADYRGGLDGRSFRAKWMGNPQHRQVYEAAIAAGKI